MLPNSPTGVKTRQDQKIINFPRVWREVRLERIAGTTTFIVVGDDTASPSPQQAESNPQRRLVKYTRSGRTVRLEV